MWPFASGFIHLAGLFSTSSMWRHVPALHSFSLLHERRALLPEVPQAGLLTRRAPVRPLPRCGRHRHRATPVPRRGPWQLHLQHHCPALQYGLCERHQGHGPGEVPPAELGWAQVWGTVALSNNGRGPDAAVEPGHGLSRSFPTPLLRNPSSPTRL